MSAPVFIPDLETLQTHDDVSAMYKAVHDEAKAYYYIKKNSLPTGQPDGLEAFLEKDRKSVYVYTRSFKGRSYDVLVVAQQIGDKFHVCFWGDSQRLYTPDDISSFAAEMLKEAEEIQKQNDIKDHFANKKGQGFPSVRNFILYTYRPAQPHEYGQEFFERYDILQLFSRSPIEYDKVPKIIKNAREKPLPIFVPATCVF